MTGGPPGLPSGGVALIVLTGGAGRRMGREKATIGAGGVALAQRPVMALRDVCGEVVLAGRPVAGITAAVVPDAVPGGGPLTAVAGALGAVRAPVAVVVACDMPAVDARLVRLLLARVGAGAAEAAVCARRGVVAGIEPFPLVVLRSAAPALRAAVAGGVAAMGVGLARLRLDVVPEAEWRLADPGGASFENWNRPADVRILPDTPDG